MAVNSTANSIEHTATGSVVFAFPYLFYDQVHLFVYTKDPITLVTTLRVLTTDYTVTGAGNPSGGNVTFNSAPSTGTLVTIIRVVPLTQLLTLNNNDAFPAPSINQSFDLLMMAIQQLGGTGSPSDRALKFPDLDTSSSILPDIAGRALKQLGFDAVGNILLNADIGRSRGNWTTGTLYNYRDTFVDSSTGNLYQAIATTGYTSDVSISADVSAGNALLLLDVAAIVAATTGAQIYDTYQYAVSTSSANTYAATLTPVPTSYQTGARFTVKFTHGNTGAATLNFNALGTKNIFYKGAALGGGEIADNQICDFEYDGTELVIINPSISTSLTATYAAAGTNQGTATLITTSSAKITSGTGGVILTGGLTSEVNNQLAIDILIYPASGGAINGGSANAAITIHPGGTVIFNSTSSINVTTIQASGTASTSPVSFSPTTTNLGTLTNVNCIWARDGSFMEIIAAFTTGSEVANPCTFAIPLSQKILSTLTQTQVVGDTVSNGNSAGTNVVAVPNSSNLQFCTSSSFPNPLTGANSFNANSQSAFFCRIPIDAWTNNN